MDYEINMVTNFIMKTIAKMIPIQAFRYSNTNFMISPPFLRMSGTT